MKVAAIMKSKIVTCFYTVGLLHHLFTFYYSKTQVDFSKTTKPQVLDIQNFNNRYLTSWNMGIQTLYFMFALVLEILMLSKSKNTMPKTMEKLNNIRGYFFSVILLPCTTVVASFFWIVYFINKDFVMPNGIEEVFPDWVNHSIHTNIIFLPIIELVFQQMPLPSTKNAIIGLTIFSHVYNSFYLFTYFQTGKWLYALYDHLSWPQRIMFMELLYVMSIVFCQLGIFIQKMKSDACDITKSRYKKRVASVTKKLL